MQGYVTELMLTLEAAVDALHSDFRPIEFVKELFKSTPNLNNKERKCGAGCNVLLPLYKPGHVAYSSAPTKPVIVPGSPCHLRSTSFSISYARGKQIACPDVRKANDRQYASSLSRSRSAHSLAMLADQNNDDKLSMLAQMFWIAVSFGS